MKDTIMNFLRNPGNHEYQQQMINLANECFVSISEELSKKVQNGGNYNGGDGMEAMTITLKDAQLDLNQSGLHFEEAQKQLTQLVDQKFQQINNMMLKSQVDKPEMGKIYGTISMLTAISTFIEQNRPISQVDQTETTAVTNSTSGGATTKHNFQFFSANTTTTTTTPNSSSTQAETSASAPDSWWSPCSIL